MKVYDTSAIRNVAFVGHSSSGKTTLVDALAFTAGSSRRHGSINEGTTLTDHTPDEIERKHSIGLGIAYAEWRDTKINMIDAPGYLDFLGEATTALHTADAAVIVISGVSGVEVGTEKVWDICDQLHLPRIIFVSQMDKDRADFDRVFDDVKEHLSPKVVPVEIPIGNGTEFHGIINLLTGKAHDYARGTKSGEYEEVPIPEEYSERFAKYDEQLVEAIAATDDALLERYLGGEEIPREAIVATLKKGLLAGEIVPMLCGSPTLTYGMRALLTDMVDLFPSPAEVPTPDEGPLVARVFKVVSEPHVGDVTFFRLYHGGVKNGQEVWNSEHSVSEKLNHLTVQQGKERTEVPELREGDIGSVAKLKDTHTNDTFSLESTPVMLPPIPFPEPVANSAVAVKQRGEEDKLAAGLHKLHEEDPTFHFEYSSELGQTLIHGMGEKHFEVILDRLQRKFGVHAELVRPKVAYRETIKGRAEGQGKHKKQSGGRGQYGDCWIRMAPQPRGAGYHCGLPAGGLQGRVLRRVLPRRGLERNVVQDGRHPGLPERGAEMPPGAAGAPDGRVHLDARRHPGRRHGRPEQPAGPDSRYRAGRPAHQGQRRRAGGRAVQVQHHASLHDARTRNLPPGVQGVFGSATGRGGQGGGRAPEGQGGGVSGRP
jgi:elongation factor G